jgi:60 kDa SS-A/Ro ribonucleoprotein
MPHTPSNKENTMPKMSSAYKQFTQDRKATPITEPIIGREADQVKTHGGGYAFSITDMAQFRRFLILGTEGGTYYQDQRTYTRENAKVAMKAIAANGPAAVALIREVSAGGLAPRNVPATFALSLAATADDVATRQAAMAALPDVCRVGTDLFQFLSFVGDTRGWGRAMKTGVANYMRSVPVDRLALHAIKYRQRDGWTYRDVLRLCHATTDEAARSDVFNFMVKGEGDHKLFAAFRKAQSATNVKDVITAIEAGLPWEAVPDQWRKTPAVWAALLPHMGATAMTRQLATLARLEMLTPMSATSKFIINKFNDVEFIKRSKAHPMVFLLASGTYGSGGILNSRSRGVAYVSNPAIVDSLTAAYLSAFQNVVPTGKNFYLGIDISGSMDFAHGSGLSARTLSCAMALVTAATEPWTYACGFTTGPNRDRYGYSRDSIAEPIDLNKRTTLKSLLRASKDMSQRMGGTDLSLPMVDAMKKKMEVDVFVVYTDNETTHHGIHPTQALDQYNKVMGRNARLAVVGITSTGFSIADPKRNDMMDFVGMDASTPRVLSEFAAGSI